MSTGRPCVICSDAGKLRLAAELIAEGATDHAIATRLGGIHRMAVSRHRRNHVEAPAKVLVKAAAKGRDMVEQRNQVITAAASGELDPVTRYLAEAAIVDYMRPVGERLERNAAAAEQDGQRAIVATTSQVQIRHAEARARMGGMGGYRTPAASPGGGGPRFSVNIIFSNGQQETITTIDNPSAPEVDAGDPDE